MLSGFFWNKIRKLTFHNGSFLKSNVKNQLYLQKNK